MTTTKDLSQAQTQNGTLQYLRSASLTVGEKVFGVRLQFTVEQDQAGEVPNKSVVKAFNLSKASRDYIEQKQKGGEKIVTLAAGYGDNQSVLFSGGLFYATTERQGPDILSVLTLGAGIAWHQTAHIGLCGQMNDLQVWQELKKNLPGYGIAVGSLNQATLSAFQGVTHPGGFHYEGPVKDLLNRMTRQSGIRWSVDCGALHFYRGDSYQDNSELLLSKETGLIGYPAKVRDQNFKAKALLNAQLKPGKRVTLQSQIFVTSANQQGLAEMRIIKTTHQGDTLEGDWSSEFEAQTLNTSPTFLRAEDD